MKDKILAIKIHKKDMKLWRKFRAKLVQQNKEVWEVLSDLIKRWLK